MTPHRHWIRNYRPYRVPVELANGTVIYSAGMGTVVIDPVIEGQGVRSVELTRFLHVPQLRSNLLSCLYLTRCCSLQILIDSTFMHFMRNKITLFWARINPSNATFVEGTVMNTSVPTLFFLILSHWFPFISISYLGLFTSSPSVSLFTSPLPSICTACC